jgi:hypothetical protein
MNDPVLVCGAIVIAIVGFFAIMAAFVGSPATLCEAKIGEVYNFEYLQPLKGQKKRYLARVIEEPVRFSDQALERMNKASSYRVNDPEFKRTNHVVTCESHDGEIRQFYCERAVNCRKPLLGGFLA